MSRELFEKHIRENYPTCLEYGKLSLEMDYDGSYVHGVTNGFWLIWQAARASIEQQRDELLEVIQDAIDELRYFDPDKAAYVLKAAIAKVQ